MCVLKRYNYFVLERPLFHMTITHLPGISKVFSFLLCPSSCLDSFWAAAFCLPVQFTQLYVFVCSIVAAWLWCWTEIYYRRCCSLCVVFAFVCVWGPTPVIHRAYYWLFAQGWLLTMFRRPYAVPATESGSAACKASMPFTLCTHSLVPDVSLFYTMFS